MHGACTHACLHADPEFGFVCARRSPSEDLREELTTRGLQGACVGESGCGKGVKEEPGRSDAMLGDGACSQLVCVQYVCGVVFSIILVRV